MSERFVRGWKVSPKKLRDLVGSEATTARVIVASKANARVRTDVFMTLGDGEAADGKALVLSTLDEILGGKLRKEARYDYARVLELVLNAEALPMKGEILMQLTYAAPNDTHGRWNPMLRALGLKKLAKVWGTATLAWPLAKAKPIDWPTWMLLEGATLRAVADELATVTRARVDALPAAIVADQEDWVADARTELLEGLGQLRAWTKSALAPERREGLLWSKKECALLLSMDGDQ